MINKIDNLPVYAPIYGRYPNSTLNYYNAEHLVFKIYK